MACLLAAGLNLWVPTVACWQLPHLAFNPSGCCCPALPLQHWMKQQRESYLFKAQRSLAGQVSVLDTGYRVFVATAVEQQAACRCLEEEGVDKAALAAEAAGAWVLECVGWDVLFSARQRRHELCHWRAAHSPNSQSFLPVCPLPTPKLSAEPVRVKVKMVDAHFPYIHPTDHFSSLPVCPFQLLDSLQRTSQ